MPTNDVDKMSVQELMDAFCNDELIPDEYADSQDGVGLWGSWLYERVKHLLELGMLVEKKLAEVALR